jgi:hypothetical protein
VPLRMKGCALWATRPLTSMQNKQTNETQPFPVEWQEACDIHVETCDLLGQIQAHIVSISKFRLSYTQTGTKKVHKVDPEETVTADTANPFPMRVAYTDITYILPVFRHGQTY